MAGVSLASFLAAVRESISDRELLLAGSFAAAVAGVYASAARALLRRARGLTPPRWERPVLAAAAAGLLCISYGWLVEPNWLEVTHVSVASPKLAKGAKPIRLLLFSDTHSEARPRLEPRLAALARQLAPDLIVFAGDAINTPAALPQFKDMLSKMAAVAPTFAVRGNWDAWFWMGLDLFGGTGARELDGGGFALPVRGAALWVTGTAPRRPATLKAELAGAPPGALTVLVHHYPWMAVRAAALGADLSLAGHTHGGQVALPFYGAIITASPLGKRFEAGLYRLGKTSLYITRGIGMDGGFLPRVRFFARPELTLIEIAPE